MPRIGFVFIAICMVLIAISASALVVVLASATLAQAAVVGLSLLLMMVVGHMASQRQRDREENQQHIDVLERQIDTLSNDISALTQRIDRFESIAMDKAKLATAPIAAEIDVLGGLVKQFAETLENHETAIHYNTLSLKRRDAELRDNSRLLAAPPLPEPEMEPEPVVAAPAPEPQPAEPEREPVVALLEAIEQAAAHGRMDLYLQPIVTLPQRKVRWYEVQTRLRTADGTAIEQNEWRGAAEAVGAHLAIDRQALMRSAQMVRRLVSRFRDSGIVVTLSGASLVDPAFSSELESYLAANPALARSLVLQFSIADFDGLGQGERRLMAQLSALGYRFAIDSLDDFDFDAQGLARKGVRLVKASAAAIIAEAERAGAPLHPADIAADLGKAGIELVGGEVDEEAMVLDLIDFDIPLAQGLLFSTPKAVPADLLNEQPLTPPAAANAAPAAIAPRAKPAPKRVGEAATIGAAVLGAMQEQAAKKGAAGLGPGLRALIRGKR